LGVSAQLRYPLSISRLTAAATVMADDFVAAVRLNRFGCENQSANTAAQVLNKVRIRTAAYHMAETDIA
jgi:hypothetical protein